MVESLESGASLRGLPAVNTLLQHPTLASLAAPYALVLEVARAEVNAEREARRGGAAARPLDTLALDARKRLLALQRPRLRPVINATGVVINTNLGRAPLAAAALARVVAVAQGYANLELDLETGQRGSRHAHVGEAIARLTGAEAALVVNNCAAAVLLVAGGLARGRDVVVSRGQLIEIGGSFRLPDVLLASGARLVEVGTTNRTYLADYERALGPDTGMLLLSHTSNYRVVGFTHEVGRKELAQLGARRGVPTVEDLGSGLLVDLAPWGLPAEPTVHASLAAGLDLVLVSGDKLLGGPQCGLVLGKRALVARLAAEPLMRAFRPDKLVLAALEATLDLYRDGQTHQVPVLEMLARTASQLEAAAHALAALLPPGMTTDVVPGVSAVGGGTLPGVELPTTLVRLRHPTLRPAELARRLRLGEPAVVGRVADDWLLLDPRTLAPGDAAGIATALKALTP